MKKNKNLMLLLAAGAAYWYFAIYLRNKNKGLPQYDDVKIKEDMAIEAALNMPNVPLMEAAPARLQPTGFLDDFTFGGGINPNGMYSGGNQFNVKYTMSGYRSLGKVPNSI
jgi:hypothetical protein